MNWPASYGMSAETNHGQHVSQQQTYLFSLANRFITAQAKQAKYISVMVN